MQASYKQKCKFTSLLPEAVCCGLQTCNRRFIMRVVWCVYQVLLAEKSIYLQRLVPEAICCCLQTCNSCNSPYIVVHRYYH